MIIRAEALGLFYLADLLVRLVFDSPEAFEFIFKLTARFYSVLVQARVSKSGVRVRHSDS